MVKAEPKGKVTAAPGSGEAAEGRQGSCRRVHRRVRHQTHEAPGRKRLKPRPRQREIINISTSHGLRDENLRLRASAPWSETAAAPGARLVHLLVTHAFNEAPNAVLWSPTMAKFYAKV
jgi:hypothetical protein